MSNIKIFGDIYSSLSNSCQNSAQELQCPLQVGCKNVVVLVAGLPGMEFFSHSMGLSPSFSAPSTDCSDQAENKITYNLSVFEHDTAPAVGIIS